MLHAQDDTTQEVALTVAFAQCLCPLQLEVEFSERPSKQE